MKACIFNHITRYQHPRYINTAPTTFYSGGRFPPPSISPPGFIEGEWLEKGMGAEMYEAVKSQVQTTTPLKKTCSPESIAEVILNLIESSELMTGQLVTVDGGASLNL